MAGLNTERVQFERALANLLSQYTSGEIVAIPTGRLSLINYVKAKLDQIIPEGEGVQFALNSDTNVSDPTSILVNAFLEEAAKKVLLTAPLHVLEPVKSEEVSVPDTGGDKTGYIPLPDNFLRLVSLKMTDWQREVTEPITTSDSRYKLQRNKFTRGGTAKPVAVYSFRTTDGSQRRVIEYYSVDSNHAVEWLYYVPETLAENIQDSLVDALTWMCAGIVLQVTGLAELAKATFEQVGTCYENI